MKKIIFTEILLIALLAFVMIFLLSGTKTREVSLQAVEKEFSDRFSENSFEKADALRLKRAFSLSSADYEEYFYLAPDNTMSVDEAVVILLKDESQKASVKEAFENRLKVQKKNFDGYGTNQTELLENAVIYTKGLYCVFLVGEKAEEEITFLRNCWEEPNGIFKH